VHVKVHPLVSTGNRQLWAGAAIGAVGVGLGLAGTPLALCGSVGVLALYFARNGRALRTAGIALPTLHDSLKLITKGQYDEAERLPEQLPPGVRKRPMIARVIANQSTLVALMRGDAEAAEKHATASLALKSQYFTSEWDEVQRCEAAAMRALARAGRGDAKGAEEDIAYVEKSEHALPGALARSALARASLIARSGDKTKLAEELGRSGNLILENVMPRDRSLVRALRALARAPGKSVYREAARREEDASEEAKVRAWIEMIAPDAAAYAPHEAPAQAVEQAPPVAAPEAMQAIAAARKQAPRNNRARAIRVAALWAILVMMFLAIWQFLSPDPGATPHHATQPAAPFELPFYFAPLIIATILGSIAWVHHRYRKQQRRVLRAGRDIALGATGAARKELLAVAGIANFPALGASARATLAQLANKQAEFAAAIEHCDAGLALANGTPATRALAADQVTPQLIGERAMALAALGRFGEAEGELSHLVHGFGRYALLPSALFKVRLVSAVRRGDFGAAAELARSRTPEMPIDLRIDLLADVALMESGDPIGKEERERITTELRSMPDVNSWVEQLVGDRRVRVAAPPPEEPMHHDQEEEEEIPAVASASRRARS
jgi:hypothetical protein